MLVAYVVKGMPYGKLHEAMFGTGTHWLDLLARYKLLWLFTPGWPLRC